MIKVAIIGRGNVATHLYEALKNKAELTLVNPHTLENMPENPDIILISVSDRAISEVAAKINDQNAVIAHTAGSVPMSILNDISRNIGVFYPLQTFTKGVALDYSSIPVFIEGSNMETGNQLKSLAYLFSNEVVEADSEARKKLHLASVFACNFTNALAAIASDILKDSGIQFDTIIPLMEQTVNKLHYLSPKDAQTGPAVRGDKNVMDMHSSMLKTNPQYQKLYSLLSNIIYNKK